MTAASMIRQSIDALQRAAPDATIILFGSQSRGTATPESDFDFLVVRPRVHDRRAEAVQLRDALRPLGVVADILVYSRDKFEYWRETPNTVAYEAAREGQVFGPLS